MVSWKISFFSCTKTTSKRFRLNTQPIKGYDSNKVLMTTVLNRYYPQPIKYTYQCLNQTDSFPMSLVWLC